MRQNKTLCEQCKLFWISERDNKQHCFKHKKLNSVDCKDFERSGFLVWGKSNSIDSDIIFARELFDEGMSQV